MQSAQFQLHADLEQRHWWFVARRRILRSLVNQLVPPGQGATVIDVGCGSGGNAAALASQYDCVGIDTSAEAIALADRRFPLVRFIHGEAPDDLGELAGRAKLWMLNDVLEHVPDDFALFSRILAATRPGAYLLVTVPADRSLWSAHDEAFGHYRRYDLQRFAQVWEGLPVRALLSTYFNSRLFPLVKIARARNRRKGGAQGVAGTVFRLPSPPLNRLLQGVFASERYRLMERLAGAPTPGFARGVSLIAVLQRQPGEVMLRSKPVGIAADLFDPVAAG